MESLISGITEYQRNSGEFRAGSNQQMGQRVAADYFLEPPSSSPATPRAGWPAGSADWGASRAGAGAASPPAPWAAPCARTAPTSPCRWWTSAAACRSPRPRAAPPPPTSARASPASGSAAAGGAAADGRLHPHARRARRPSRPSWTPTTSWWSPPATTAPSPSAAAPAPAGCCGQLGGREAVARRSVPLGVVVVLAPARLLAPTARRLRARPCGCAMATARGRPRLRGLPLREAARGASGSRTPDAYRGENLGELRAAGQAGRPGRVVPPLPRPPAGLGRRPARRRREWRARGAVQPRPHALPGRRGAAATPRGAQVDAAGRGQRTPPAQRAVGQLHLTGLDTMGQDLSEARTWLAAAASAATGAGAPPERAGPRPGGRTGPRAAAALLSAHTAAHWASAPTPPMVAPVRPSRRGLNSASTIALARDGV
jgi:hypothetical protein